MLKLAEKGAPLDGPVAGVAKVVHAVGNKLCADAGLGPAPDDETFLRSLLVTGDHWGLGEAVRWAIGGAPR